MFKDFFFLTSPAVRLELLNGVLAKEELVEIMQTTGHF
jgi:hypothetical protein